MKLDPEIKKLRQKNKRLMSKELNSNSKVIGEGGVVRNEKGQLAKGSILNPLGRGHTKGFATKFKMFIQKVADNNNSTYDEEEQKLFWVAYIRALEGDFPFYKDIFDRVYGKPTQPTEDLTQRDEPDVKAMFDKLREKANKNKNVKARAPKTK